MIGEWWKSSQICLVEKNKRLPKDQKSSRQIGQISGKGKPLKKNV
jgi:hypothetical protein